MADRSRDEDRRRHEHRRHGEHRGRRERDDIGFDRYASNFFGAPIYGYGYADDREGYGGAPRSYRGGFGYGGYGQSNVAPRFGTDYRPGDRYGPDIYRQAATGLGGSGEDWPGYGGHGEDYYRGYGYGFDDEGGPDSFARPGGAPEDRGQGHRGRGPKGYRRSDERIREDVSDRMSDDPQLDASDIDVSVRDAEVTLHGTVDCRAAKRRAEDIAENVSGVRHVQNNLRLATPPRTE